MANTPLAHWRNSLLWAGLLGAATLLCLGVGAIAVLGMVHPTADGSLSGFWAGFWTSIDHGRVVYALKSAGLQASYSVAGSILIAIPAAIAVCRRPHWVMMRGFVTVISLAMVVPTTVAAMGLLSVWGRQGVIPQICRTLGLDGCDDMVIYGLHGVVLAHMMLNVPLMMRVFIPLLQAIPERRHHVSALLGLGIWGHFRHVQFPQIKPAIPGVAALVFLLCFTSFALVLMLGGGPKVTTLEVEIYSAVRFDFNLAAAAGLSLVQFVVAAVVVALLATRQQFDRPAPLSTPFITKKPPRYSSGGGSVWGALIIDSGMMAVMIMLVVLPIAMIAAKGFSPDLMTLLKRPQFWDALRASLSVSVISALAVTGLALLVSYARAVMTLPHRLGLHSWAKRFVILLDAGIMLYLVIPSIVLGTAAFIVLRGTGDIFGYGFIVVVTANVLMALPFAVKLLDRRMAAILAMQDRPALLLGITGLARLKVLILPPLKRDLGSVVGLTAALSIGDLGVIALFAQPDFQTLPWLLYQLAGRYAAGEAAGLALILLVLTVVMFMLARGAVSLIITLVSGVRHA